MVVVVVTLCLVLLRQLAAVAVAAQQGKVVVLVVVPQTATARPLEEQVYQVRVSLVVTPVLSTLVVVVVVVLLLLVGMANLSYWAVLVVLPKTAVSLARQLLTQVAVEAQPTVVVLLQEVALVRVVAEMMELQQE
jgi:hypothetical protein